MNNKNTIFKVSPLGKIPSDWEVVRISDYGKVYTGNTPPTTDLENYGDEFLFVSPSDLGADKYIFNTEKKLSKNGFSFSRKFPKGSVLFTCIGSTIGKSGVAAIELTSNQQINAIVVDKKYSNEFLYYVLEYNSHKIKLLAGEQAVPILNKSQFESVRIICPPLPEQKAIASLLSTWDEAITKNQALISQKELRKKWLMQNLLTGKKRLEGFDGDWTEVPLGGLFKHIRNFNDGDNCHSIMTISSKLGLVSQEDKFYRVIAGDSLKKYTQLRREDFAYNKGNSKTYPMGCIYQLEEKESALVPFVYICFSPSKSINAKYYKHWFLANGLDRQLKKIITSGARGDGLLNVNTDDFFKLKVPFPELDEQTAIANLLQTAEKEIQLLKAKTEKLLEQKKGLMQVLLTGKKRLKY
jgi:type I restriction enzyme, S subunit